MTKRKPWIGQCHCVTRFTKSGQNGKDAKTRTGGNDDLVWRRKDVVLFVKLAGQCMTQLRQAAGADIPISTGKQYRRSSGFRVVWRTVTGLAYRQVQQRFSCGNGHW